MTFDLQPIPGSALSIATGGVASCENVAQRLRDGTDILMGGAVGWRRALANVLSVSSPAIGKGLCVLGLKPPEEPTSRTQIFSNIVAHIR